MDTSTQEGRERRLRILEEQQQRRLLENLRRKYKATKNKSIGWAIHSMTGEGDNFPGPDSDPS